MNLKIGFVGLGKLGRDVAEVMSEYYNVVGYDINKDIKTTITKAETLELCVKDKDIVFIAVQTPHHPDYDGRYPTNHLKPKDFDYTIVSDVLKNTDQHVTNKTLIVLISTVLPGTFRNKFKSLIKNGRYIYNPYLIAQGTVKDDVVNPEMVILGTEKGDNTPDSDLMKDFYKKFVNPSTRFEVGTWEEAEGIKIFYNTFITTKICLVNMIQDCAERIPNMNCDVVANALMRSDKRILGPMYMKPGLGDGGGCHPRDNIALRWLSDEYKFNYDFFQNIIYTRDMQAKNMALKVFNFGNNDVVILGKSFKPNIEQYEGSPSILVGSYLEELGANVYYDVEAEISKKTTYLVCHPNKFLDYPYKKGSVVVDVWRQIKKSDNYDVYHYGNSRDKNI